MSNDRIRIGILGAAKIAQRSMAPAILQLSDRYRLVAVASRDARKGAGFAAAFGCEAITGYDGLLARKDIDAVYVPLPTGLHNEWVGKAIDAGKHVYVEKSFAPDLVQTESLIDTARCANLALMEGYMFLYHRQQAVVLQLLREGAIGELRHFHGSFGFPPLPEDDFRYDEVIGGGVLMDAAGYPLRAAHFFAGDGLQVAAASVGRDFQRGSSLWGSAYLLSDDHVGASIAFGFDNHYQCRYELWGSKGKLVAERAYTAGPTFAPQLLLENASGGREIQVPPDNHFIGALLEFHNIIIDPGQRPSHYEQILRQSRSLTQIRDLSLLPSRTT